MIVLIVLAVVIATLAWVRIDEILSRRKHEKRTLRNHLKQFSQLGECQGGYWIDLQDKNKSDTSFLSRG